MRMNTRLAFGVFKRKRIRCLALCPCDRVLFLEYEARAKLAGAEQGSQTGHQLRPDTGHNRSAAPLTVFSQQRGLYSPAPPPYLAPPSATFSSSTPDLASQAALMAGQGGGVGVGGSSPDLVSR